jgi:hypothetical protein
MFRPITQEGLEFGVEKLRQFMGEHPGVKIQNDKTITRVVAKDLGEKRLFQFLSRHLDAL